MEMSLVDNLAVIRMLVTLDRTWLHFPNVTTEKHIVLLGHFIHEQ